MPTEQSEREVSPASSEREVSPASSLLTLVRELKNYVLWQREQLWDGLPCEEHVSWGSPEAAGVDDLLASAPAPEAQAPSVAAQAAQSAPAEGGGEGALSLLKDAMASLEGGDGAASIARRASQAAPPPAPERVAMPLPQERQPGAPDRVAGVVSASELEVITVPPEALHGEPLLRLSLSRELGEDEVAARRAALQELYRDWYDCTRCVRAQGRTQVVLGEGSVHTRMMLVGEGPSQQEDQDGAFWSGTRGQLLVNMLQAIGIVPSEVFLSAVVRCYRERPRIPRAEEIDACFPLLQEELRLIQPDFVITLGAVATQSLLRETKRLAHLRGIWHNHQGVQVFPTYSPAYLLSRPRFKGMAWVDWLAVRSRLVEHGCVAS